MENMSFDHQIFTCKQALYNFALGFTKNFEDANDLVQDTFVKAIRHADQYTEGTSMMAWLYIILKNTYLNNYHRSFTRNKVIAVTEDFTSPQLVKSSATNSGPGKLINQDINKALKTLPEEYRIPFIRYFEGFKYVEIANEFNIPVGTVKTRIHMARKILKSKLKMYS